MGSLFSMFSKPTQNPNMGIWNGNEYSNTNMRERNEMIGGKNKTKKIKSRNQKSIRRQK
uniref:Uncharacterized protein n=1 Tax=viral metagenome TaxID=1070528 RepID=A0A6C0IGZ1_9ZZZZ